MSSFTTILSCLLHSIILLYHTESAIYHVDPSSPASGSGVSWQSPMRTLDTALLVARSSIDEIWLKSGHIYTPSTKDRSDCFRPAKGLKIYGGFDGSETNINQRRESDPLPTILSGDIGIIDDMSDNCYHVLQYEEILYLDNIIIQYGNANGNTDIYNAAAQDNVLNRYGGAIMTRHTAMQTELYLSNVIIRNNTALNGGAIFIQSHPHNHVNVFIEDSIFEYNTAIKGKYEGGYGGAIYTMFLAAFYLNRVEFISNHADFRGGAIYQDYGGIISVEQCLFDGNSANGWGGAIFSEDRNSQTKGTFPNVTNSVFRRNIAGIDGGGIFFYNHVEGRLIDNQFTGNIADEYGGAIACIDSQFNETGSTYYRNIAIKNDSCNDDYYLGDIQYDDVDESLSFNLSQELDELYDTYLKMIKTVPEKVDPYPFNTETEICYVAANSLVGGGGHSWHTAFDNIQLCIDKLSILGNGGEIWVKYGTYLPTIVPAKTLNSGRANSYIHRSFELSENIRIYGGFKGTEIYRYERNWRDYPTYLSCQQNKKVQCNQLIIAAQGTLIDGFILMDAGRGMINLEDEGTNKRSLLQNSLTEIRVLTSSIFNAGAGIFSNSTNITIINSIFHKLISVSKGGGVYCIGKNLEDLNITSSPIFTNVAFLGNRAGIRGGAISADVGCDFICNSCKFDSNSCSKKGGAIYLDFSSNPIFDDKTIFKNNYALESGGCIAGDGASFALFKGSFHPKFESNAALMEGGCLYSGSGAGPGFNQGFGFHQVPLFINNYMLNDNHIGYKNYYGWPYSIFDVPLPPTTAKPSLAPTPAPTTDAIHFKDGKPPNIIVFVIDDMLFTKDWEIMAPSGTDLIGKSIHYDDYPLPNIERFMSEGVIFQQTYAGGPKCSPSRYSILTGRQPTRSAWAKARTLKTCSGELGPNITIQTSKLAGNDSFSNLMYVLQNDKNTPYYTGMVGKWHIMSSDDNGYNYGCSSLSTMPNEELYNNCTEIVRKQGFNFVDAFYYSNVPDNPYFNHNPEWMTSQTQKFIEKSQLLNKPFFLYFASTLTHDPRTTYDALFNYTRRQSPKGILKGKDDPTDTLMSTREEIWGQSLSSSNNFQKAEAYAIHYWLDDSFGALINYLKLNNIYDNTFIIVTNDHGMGSKGTMYQQGSRIAQFVRYPPLFTDNGPVIMPKEFVTSNVDIAAVIFEITRITPPNDYIIDGKSWVKDVQNVIANWPNIEENHKHIKNDCGCLYSGSISCMNTIKGGHIDYF